MLRKIRSSRAFTLVELMIVVAIIGLLAALAIYGVRRYMTNSKTAEARQALGAISKGARAAFEGEVWTSTAVLTPGGEPSTSSSGNLCPAAKAVPDFIPKSQKYQSTNADWDGDAGWSCLRFSMSGPQYFQYEVTRPTDDDFLALARADLGNDGEVLTLSLEGAIKEDGGKRILAIAPAIAESTGDGAAPPPDGEDE